MYFDCANKHVEVETGHSQWEPPTEQVDGDYEGQQAPIQQTTHHAPKKRQYAAGQSQAYYGTPEPEYNPGFGAPAPQYPAMAAPVGQQLFTPAAPDAVQAPYGGNVAGSGGYYDQQQYPTAPPAAYGGGVGVLADQFSQMGMGTTQGQAQQAVRIPFVDADGLMTCF